MSDQILIDPTINETPSLAKWGCLDCSSYDSHGGIHWCHHERQFFNIALLRRCPGRGIRQLFKEQPALTVVPSKQPETKDVIAGPFLGDPDERLWCGTCGQFMNVWCKKFRPGSLYNVEFIAVCPLDKEKRS